MEMKREKLKNAGLVSLGILIGIAVSVGVAGVGRIVQDKMAAPGESAEYTNNAESTENLQAAIQPGNRKPDLFSTIGTSDEVRETEQEGAVIEVQGGETERQPEYLTEQDGILIEVQGGETERQPEYLTEQSGPNGSSQPATVYQMEQTFLETTGTSYGMAAVKDPVSGLWGYVDKTGSYVIDPVYYGAYPFSAGLAAVNVGNAWGFIDTQGNMVLEPVYSSVEKGIFTDGCTKVSGPDTSNGTSGGYKIDVTGQIWKEPDYEGGESNHSKGSVVPKNVDSPYRVITSAEDRSLRVMNTDGSLFVKLNDLAQGAYSDCYVDYYTQNYMVISRVTNGIVLSAVIDYEGNILIDFKYKELIPFRGEKYLLAQYADGTSFVIDISGNVIREVGEAYIPSQYSVFSDELSVYCCSARDENGNGFIKSAELMNNQTGEIVYSIDFSGKSVEEQMFAHPFIFMKSCFVTWHDSYHWIYDYNGNLLYEFDRNRSAELTYFQPYLEIEDHRFTDDTLLLPYYLDYNKVTFVVVNA